MDPLKQARKLVILVIGATVFVLGVAMLVLPGPGIAVIIGALAILATEFVWAATLLHRVKVNAQSAARSVWNKSKDSGLSRIIDWFRFGRFRSDSSAP